MFRIAIIGAGFCGLAVAYHLLAMSSKKPIQVIIYDAKGIGGGASGISAGLLHPFAGAHAKLNRMGKEGLQATVELLKIASLALGEEVANENGILRLALSPEQEADFKLSALNYPDDVEWLTEESCHLLFPYLKTAPGIWMKHGKVVNSSLYLKGLWKACENKGAIIEMNKIYSLSEMDHFDMTIVAAGPECTSFPEISHLPLTFVKGQVLELEWPQNLPILPFTLNSQAYLIMNEKQKTCIVGATFEKKFRDSTPDLEVAEKDILPKVIAMLPALEGARVLRCHAGVRVVTPNHLPLVEKIGGKQWIFTGMGSKGLLYHALMAKQLAQNLL